MKFGMLHLFENPVDKTEYQIVKEQLDLMRAADDLGFDTLWPAEHHFSEYGYCVSTAVTLAALSQVTKRIRLGSAVVVLPFHNPIRVAEEFAMLDLMSDGRLEFGVGRGYQPTEYKGFQVDQTKSRGIFNEAMEVILQAWTQERVNYRGVHFQFEDQPVRPKPLQKPHPPIWMAALSPESFALAGKKGWNLLCAPVFGFAASPESQQLLESYRAALRSAGHDPATKQIASLAMIYCAETAEQARRDFADPVIWYYRTISKYIAPPAEKEAVKGYEAYPNVRDFAAAVTFKQLVDAGSVVCGDIDHCIQRLKELRDFFGFTQILCWTRLGGFDHRKVIKSMELMQKYVIPHFKKEEAKAA